MHAVDISTRERLLDDTAADACGAVTAELPLYDFARKHIKDNWYTWAMHNYKDTLTALIGLYGCRSLLEVGGGRSPLFSEAEVGTLRVRYTVNDISDSELRLCPAWAEKACFDIAGGETPRGAYDLIFSRMVLEHVRRGESAYRNIYSLLRSGGIALNFHPTLFAPPFLVNSLMPYGLSDQILKVLFGARMTDAIVPYPKFPAHYSWCHSTGRIATKLRNIGFHEVFVAPFYGHGYLRKIPLIGAVDDALSKLARSLDFRPYSSYAYVMVRR